MNDELTKILTTIAGGLAVELYKRLSKGENVMQLTLQELIDTEILSEFVKHSQLAKAERELED